MLVLTPNRVENFSTVTELLEKMVFSGSIEGFLFIFNPCQSDRLLEAMILENSVNGS